jgi:putative colanic acid biosynthesis acetyltransferase WcaF
MAASRVDLSLTSNRGYDHGRSLFLRALWMWVEVIVLLNPLITSFSFKRWLLRRFGAEIGPNVIIKPSVHIKHPWRLRIGANAWIGERAWIDNLAAVAIGANACVSQGAYICTGNHDWSDPGMGLVVAPIEVGEGAWVGAFAKVAPGVTVGEQAVLCLGSVLFTDAEPDGIYLGNPAERIGTRALRDVPGAPPEIVAAPDAREPVSR